jgi:Putative beta-lactamase-inhibitor-like, PepSY-like
MKKLIFVFVSVLTISLLTSCNKEETVTEDSLIEEITTSSSKVNVEPEELPAQARQTIEDDYFETYVETVSRVDNKGFEITMGNEDVMYCNMRGEELRGSDQRFGPHRPGPCGRGEPVNIDELPDAIVDYITENYPGQDILRAKLKGGKYLVKIAGHMILVFEENGTFLLEAPIYRFCHHFVDRINIDNLLDVITDYISENYPNAEIKIAWRIRGKIVVGIITPDGRKIVVFDLDGNFLFDRG